MNSIKDFFSIWKIVITVLFLVILGGVSTAWFIHNDNEITQFLTIKQSNVDSLVNTVWQVHTAIATLTIALMTLLVGFNTNKKYGINSLEYILVIRKSFFKYQDEIIISIFLIFVQYFFVAYQALSGVILIFSFNIFLIGHMVYTNIKLSLGDSQVSKEIKTYLIEEIKNAIIFENYESKSGKNNIDSHMNNLFKHSQILIENKQIDELNNNIQLLEDLLIEIIKNSNKPQSSKILKVTIDIFDDIFTEMIKKNMSNEAITKVIEIYKIINLNENKISVDFNNTLVRFIKYLNEESSAIKLFDLPIVPLFYEIFNNTEVIDDYFYDNDIAYYIGMYYANIQRNVLLTEENKFKLIQKIYLDILSWPRFKASKNQPERTKLIQKIIEILMKNAIIQTDGRSFKYFLEQLYKDFMIKEKDMSKDEIYIKICIYLYYLIEKEETISGNKKEDMKELLKTNSKLLTSTIGSIYNFWDYYKKVEKEMRSWEHFEIDSGAKILIMESVVTEFFYFASLSLNRFSIDAISEDILNENEMFLFFNRYTSKGVIKDTTKRFYNEFKMLFVIKDGSTEKELEYLFNALMGRYKKFLFSQKREILEKVSLEKGKLELRDKVNKFIDKNEFFNLIPKKKVFSNHLRKQNILSLSMPLVFLESAIDDAVNIINENLSAYIKEILKAQNIRHELMEFSTLNKISKLKSLVYNNPGESMSIDRMIFGIDEKSSYLYLETDEDKNELKDLLDQIPVKIKTTRQEWIGINTKDILLRFSDWDIEIAYFNDGEINRVLETSKIDDYYSINVTNDIYLKFAEEEAREYLKMDKVIIRASVYIDIELKYKVNGFIIEVK